MNTAHAIRRVGMARVTGRHLHAVNEPATLPLPLPAGPALPRRIDSEPEAVHQARLAAVRRLGADWLLHPDYRFRPRHSNDPRIYEPARAAHESLVAALAADARRRNPAWIAAQRVRDAITSSEA
jgi:hypothetical protein